MKKILVVVICILALLVCACAAAETRPVILDEAGLLDDTAAEELSRVMEAVCPYCTPVFWSTDAPDTSDTMAKAENRLIELIGEDDGIIFTVDMACRQLVIWSTARIHEVISTDRVNGILDNTYVLATQGDYAGCAKESFARIAAYLEESDLSRESVRGIYEQTPLSEGFMAAFSAAAGGDLSFAVIGDRLIVSGDYDVFANGGAIADGTLEADSIEQFKNELSRFSSLLLLMEKDGSVYLGAEIKLVDGKAAEGDAGLLMSIRFMQENLSSGK